MIFDHIVCSDFNLDTGGNKYEFCTNGNIDHGKSEPLFMVPYFNFLLGGFLGGNRKIVPVKRDNGVINCGGYVTENIKRYLRVNIEKLAVLPNSEITQTIDGFVNQTFHLMVFFGLKCGKNLKRKWNCRIVKFTRADINRARALANFNPVFPETFIGEDIDVPGGGHIGMISVLFRHMSEQR